MHYSSTHENQNVNIMKNILPKITLLFLLILSCTKHNTIINKPNAPFATQGKKPGDDGDPENAFDCTTLWRCIWDCLKGTPKMAAWT